MMKTMTGWPGKVRKLNQIRLIVHRTPAAGSTTAKIILALATAMTRDKLTKPDEPAIDANRTSTLTTTKVCYLHL